MVVEWGSRWVWKLGKWADRASDVFLTISAQKGHTSLLPTSIILEARWLGNSFPGGWGGGLPLFWGRSAYVCLVDNWPSLPYCSRWLVLSGLCMYTSGYHTWAWAVICLPSSCLTSRFSHHMTNNWLLPAVQPITSQKTRPESRKNLVLP